LRDSMIDRLLKNNYLIFYGLVAVLIISPSKCINMQFQYITLPAKHLSIDFFLRILNEYYTIPLYKR
jgi:hypothetical protein